MMTTTQVIGHYTFDISNPTSTFDLKYANKLVDTYCMESYITSAGVFRMFFYYLVSGN